jgi:hypothetical protein
MERARAVPRLRALYPGICLTTEEKASKDSKGSMYRSGIVKSGANGTVHLCEILLQNRENCKET